MIRDFPVDKALFLASIGFHLFPLRGTTKIPAEKGWRQRSTNDPELVTRMCVGRSNLAIDTSKFADTPGGLVVIDVDVKRGKKGLESLEMLQILNGDLPPTFTQTTPSGGKHLFFRSDREIKSGVDVLGEGLDIRAKGGYAVSPWSVGEEGGVYRLEDSSSEISLAPAWLLDLLEVDVSGTRGVASEISLDSGAKIKARKRAIAYLNSTEPSIQGHGGDQRAFAVAARIKDFGCDEPLALELMLNHWNDRCVPPWDEEDLAKKVANAYAYGENPIGVDAVPLMDKPSEDIEDDQEELSPLQRVNKEYAFIKRGAFVLQETTDENGDFSTEHLTMAEFKAWFSNVPYQPEGGKTKPISDWWMEWKDRRQYEAVVFAPRKNLGHRWFNLWRGFSVEGRSGKHDAVDMFLEHALNNVCGGDNGLYHWLIGYFAHMIQRPWEKPLVALVFRGGKGVGKNALVERVGNLLGPHFMVADDDRYLTGNFNAHFESNLFLVLDEAAWAGDKRAEGKLKGLITGKHHNIERKGREPYKIENLTRVSILANEDWVVPATHDERRFAVFNVGDKRKQDRKFFKDMRVGMENGGYSNLLYYLSKYDISNLDVNAAPNTQGLIDQKHASLDPIGQWWLDCLDINSLQGCDYTCKELEAGVKVPVNILRDAFANWSKGKNIRSRGLSVRQFNKKLKEMSPSLEYVKSRPENEGDASYAFRLSGISAMREDWDEYIGGKVQWS